MVLLANRDESYDRPFDPPVAVDGVLAPRDQRAGGTWLGLNQHGVIVAITNRGPGLEHPNLRSRGQLVAEALQRPTAQGALPWLRDHLARQAYGGFHLLLADRDGALVVQHDPSPEASEPATSEIYMWRAGSFTLSNLHDPDELAVPPSVRPLAPSGAEGGGVGLEEADRAWLAAHEALAADRSIELPGGHRILKRDPILRRGTVCSALLALPADRGAAPIFRFAAGPPDRVPFVSVAASLRDEGTGVG